MKNNCSIVVLIMLVMSMSACHSPEIPVEGAKPSAQRISMDNEAGTPAAGTRTAKEMVAAGFKRYGIEKGVLIFRLDGAVNGVEALYFDHWGWREGKYIRTQSDIGPYDEKTNKVQYLDGELRYEYDPQTNAAHYFASRQVQQSADAYGTRDMTEVGIEMIRKMGGEPAGQAEIQGVNCDIWKLDYYRTILWMWKGLTMREKSAAADLPVSRICISLKTDIEVPVDKMVLPAGVQLIKAGE